MYGDEDESAGSNRGIFRDSSRDHNCASSCNFLGMEQ
jgi:hypothetical protein